MVNVIYIPVSSNNSWNIKDMNHDEIKNLMTNELFIINKNYRFYFKRTNQPDNEHLMKINVYLPGSVYLFQTDDYGNVVNIDYSVKNNLQNIIESEGIEFMEIG